jgi:hypothetical protein
MTSDTDVAPSGRREKAALLRTGASIDEVAGEFGNGWPKRQSW